MGSATPPPQPQPETPSRARQAELEAELHAEAAEHAVFMRQERARAEEREALRRDTHFFWYKNLSPEARAREDERCAAETAAFFGYTLEEIAQLPATPVLAPNPNPTTEISPQTL